MPIYPKYRGIDGPLLGVGAGTVPRKPVRRECSDPAECVPLPVRKRHVQRLTLVRVVNEPVP
jgi:hypothetical protein